MKPTLRKTTLNDLPLVYDFICKLESQVFDFEAFKSYFEENSLNPNCHHWLICVDEEPVGYVSCYVQILMHHCGKVAEIQELFIEESFRNGGLGQQVLAQIEAFARENGILQIEVSSNNRRHDAHRFYERNDYPKTHSKFIKKLK